MARRSEGFTSDSSIHIVNPDDDTSVEALAAWIAEIEHDDDWIELPDDSGRIDRTRPRRCPPHDRCSPRAATPSDLLVAERRILDRRSGRSSARSLECRGAAGLPCHAAGCGYRVAAEVLVTPLALRSRPVDDMVPDRSETCT